MAKAEAVMIQPIPPREVVGVTLTLDHTEAQFLADILARVSGSMRDSRRKHQTEISNELRRAGFKAQFPLTDITGGIRMTDFPF